MNKKIIIGIIALTLIFMFSGCNTIEEAPAQTEGFEGEEKVASENETRPFLIVGSEWAPFEYMENGEPKGIQIEIIHEVMSKLGVPYEIELLPWSRALKIVEAGEADAIISITHNDEREAFLVFTPDQLRWGETGEMPSNYVYISENVFFIRKIYEDSLKYESYEQMAVDGYRVGLNQDYSYPEARASDMIIIDHLFPTDSLNALIAGEIDVYAAEEAMGFAYAKELGILDEIAILPNPHFTKPFLMPISKKSTYPNAEEIMYAFYDEVEKLRQSGRFQEIWDKYTK